MPRPAIKRRLRKLTPGNPMNATHYIGFDVHKKHVSFCAKTAQVQGDLRLLLTSTYHGCPLFGQSLDTEIDRFKQARQLLAGPSPRSDGIQPNESRPLAVPIDF